MLAPVKQETYRSETPWGELVLTLRPEDRPGESPAAALILDGTFLMDSDASTTECAMATRGIAAVRGVRGGQDPPEGYRVLLGGLGLGLTLRELLAIDAVGFVQVVELFADVVEWNRRLLRWLNGAALEDPRVSCHAGDLLEFLKSATGDAPPTSGAASLPGDAYDLLLLDIDNGPTWLSLPSNRALYTTSGLELLRQSMKPASAAVFWATDRAAEFERQLAALSWGRWHRDEIPVTLERGWRRLDYYLYFLVRGD